MKISDKIFHKDYFVVFLASFSFFMAVNYLIPILPIYLKSLGFGNAEIGIIISAYSLSAIFLRPAAGRLYLSHGTKKLMLMGASLFLLAHPLYLVSDLLPIFILIRILHGAGTAFYSTASSIFVADVSPGARLAQAIGIYSSSISLSMGIAPALGTFLQQKLPFPILLIIPTIIALITIIAVMFIGKPVPLKSVEKSRPLREILFNKHVFVPGITWVTCSFTLGTITAFLPLYVLVIPGTNSAEFFVAYSLALISVRLGGGSLSDRYGRVKVIIPSMLLICAGVFGLSVVHSVGPLVLFALIYGIGFGLGWPTMSALVIDHAGASDRGMAIGIFSSSVDIGFFLGASLMGVVSGKLGFSHMFALAAIVPLSGVVSFYYIYVRGSRSKKVSFRI